MEKEKGIERKREKQGEYFAPPWLRPRFATGFGFS